MSRQTVPKGIYAAMVTPFDNNLRIDGGALASQVSFLSEVGIDGIFACASTGEFMNMSFEENVRSLDIVAKANMGRKPLICGACATNIVEVKRYIEEAKERGYLAAVICPPYYVRMDQSALIEYYAAAADNGAGLPVMLYNVPLFTTPLSLPTIMTLMENERIAGIKDSSAGFKQIAHMLDVRPDRSFRIFCGTDDVFLSSMAAGCDGIMTALACVLPEVMLRIRDLYERGDMAGAKRTQRSILALVRLADSLEFPLGYKLIAAARGMPVRRWYQNVSDAKVAELLKKIMAVMDELLGDKRMIY